MNQLPARILETAKCPACRSLIIHMADLPPVCPLCQSVLETEISVAVDQDKLEKLRQSVQEASSLLQDGPAEVYSQTVYHHNAAQYYRMRLQLLQKDHVQALYEARQKILKQNRFFQTVHRAERMIVRQILLENVRLSRWFNRFRQHIAEVRKNRLQNSLERIQSECSRAYYPVETELLASYMERLNHLLSLIQREDPCELLDAVMAEITGERDRIEQALAAR